jgi:hypothetical protein
MAELVALFKDVVANRNIDEKGEYNAYPYG